jgi:hypothetical protein
MDIVFKVNYIVIRPSLGTLPLLMNNGRFLQNRH